jgi:Replication initiator protein, pSAM2
MEQDHTTDHRSSRTPSLDLLREIAQAGSCSNPIRIAGEAVNLATGEVSPSRLTIACKDRRALLCRACSYLYKADAWILVSAGVIGGKGVPVSVKDHPRLFVTVTAPSFGPVHRRTASGRCHTFSSGRCPHGRTLLCRQRHDAGSPALGAPLCVDCFDYRGAVLWNAQCSRLWHRTVQELRRQVAHEGSRSRCRDPEATVSFLKVAEFQKRGLVHFHAVLRADGVGDGYPPPPSWLSTAVLIEAVRRVITHVHWTGLDGVDVRWGRQFDVIDPGTHEVHHSTIASYVAKYAVGSTDDSLGLTRRFRSRRAIEATPLDPHRKELALTAWDISADPVYDALRLDAHAHTLGFTGQIITKSRRYSTRFADLRQSRASFMARHNSHDPIEGTYRYAGRGYDDPRAATAAETLHGMVVALRREKRLRRLEEASAEGAT